MWIAIDPGLRGCGVSVWTDRGELCGASYIPGAKEGRGPQAWRVLAEAVARYACSVAPYGQINLILEVPQVYVRARSKGDPNDLIQVAAVVGALTGKLMVPGADCVAYLPAEWKGQTPKEITTARAQAALQADELSEVKLPAKSLQHNVWDAVALGLYHLKRKGIRC